MSPTMQEQLPLIAGRSAKMRQLLGNIDKIARGPWPVLILGETGTGKELVARAIHAARPCGPFVTIDCSSLVGPLMESELFGHTRGAFTGAVSAKPGLIEIANQGVAFFDEIGELPLDLQAKLLRVLQEKEFRPVGSLSSRRSDFRLIAATNRNLSAEVERGAFRRDLFYRLKVLTIHLAPLRERPEDISDLLDHFLQRFGNGHRFTPEALEVLLAYPWPGNVRELENTVQQMVAINSDRLLQAVHLPSPIQNHCLTRSAQSMAAVAAASASVPAALPRHGETRLPAPSPVIPLAELERRAILEALEYTRGDRNAAAVLLGIGRTTLYRKLKEYENGGLLPPRFP